MNFDKIVLLGTSHTLPEFNSIQTEVTENFDIEFDNHAVSSLGIDSYFLRMQMIFENNKEKKLLLLAEIPCGGRYHEFYHNNDKDYSKWSMLKKEFWGIHGEYCTLKHGKYPNYITYFNVAKLFNAKHTLVDSSITKALLKLKTLSDRRMEDENSVAQILALNAFAKNTGNEIIWFSFNNHLIKEKQVKKDFEKYSVNLVTKIVLEECLCEKYGYNDVIEMKKNSEIYPDGSHITRQDWKFLANKFFIPLLKDKLT